MLSALGLQELRSTDSASRPVDCWPNAPLHSASPPDPVGWGLGVSGNLGARRQPTSCVIWSMQTVTARINASSWSGAISMP
jgi:hypothetical protein